MTWNHQSVHMRIKYQCQECEWKFTEKGKLTRHHKSAHIGIKYPHKQWYFQSTQKPHVNIHHQSLQMSEWVKYCTGEYGDKLSM